MRQDGHPPIASSAGLLAVATWSVYVLFGGIFYFPDVPPSALTIGFFGLLACLAVILNFARWRLIVILASVVYLSFYATRVVRMLAMTTEFDPSSLPSALSFYYGASWRVTAGMLEDRGVIAGWTHGFLEYAMPVLSLALIGLAWMSRRSRSGVSQGG